MARHDAYVAVPFVSPGNGLMNALLNSGSGAGMDKKSKKTDASKKKKGGSNSSQSAVKVADSVLDRELCATLDLPPGQWLSRALPRLLGKALGDRHTLCVARCYDHWATKATTNNNSGGSGRTAALAAGAAAGEGGVAAAPSTAGNTTTAPSWRLGDASIFGASSSSSSMCGGSGSSGSGSSGVQNGFSGVVVLGLDLDASQATRVVDRGPPADDPVAAPAFRHFWGEKAELRRFKDGAIVEAVKWDIHYNYMQ